MTLEEIRDKIRAFREYFTEQDFEDMCTHCGKCCHAKAKIRGKVLIFLSQPCYFLRKVEESEYLCDVYNERFECCKNCLPIDEALARGVMPEECVYVKWLGDKDIPPARVISKLRDIGRT